MARRCHFIWLAAASTTMLGCPSEDCPPRVIASDHSCRVTDDCVKAGFTGLTCLDGRCGRTCVRDTDCALPPIDSDAPPECRDEAALDPVTICEAQVCAVGCRDSSECQGGECCVAGRCLTYHEGFESSSSCPSSRAADKQVLSFVTLEALGWNGPELGRTLRNPSGRVVRAGASGCSLGDDTCAGPAAEGTAFVVLGREVVVRVPILGTTCRACVCCLECMLSASGGTPSIPACPATAPVFSIDGTCSADPPPQCESICQACEACPKGCGATSGPCLGTCGNGVCDGSESCGNCPSDCGPCPDALLAACEILPAMRTCSSCRNLALEVETCQRTKPADECTCGGASPLPSCTSCTVCKKAFECRGTSSEFTPDCQSKIRECDLLGNDGCLSTPARYPRPLTDDEQSLESNAIDLSSAPGSLMLSFDFVSFNIGDTYLLPASTPLREGCESTSSGGRPAVRCPQEVVVELCRGDCAESSSWVEAVLIDGSTASLPPKRLRNNGLVSLGGQGAFEWRMGRVAVAIPDDDRTPGFRYRFVPRLEDGRLFGIDNVSIVRRGR